MRQRAHGNQAVQQLVAEAVGRDVASRGSAGPSEREAERVADEVVRMPEPDGKRRQARSDNCVDCGGSAVVQPKTASGTGGPSLPSDDRPASAAGRPLDRRTRSFFEPRFGVDFSTVRIHTDGRANDAAARLNARAFTYGSGIYFAREAYEPTTTSGRRLIAHELTHVLQQWDSGMAIQRDQGNGSPDSDSPQSGQPSRGANSTARIGYYVVRDRGLNAGGGTYVRDLAALKTELQRFRTSKRWTLVLSIHGSEDKLAAQSPPNWQQNAVFYEASDIRSIFGNDRAFGRWRAQWGPARLVLNACQVSASFERVLIQNLTRVPVGASSRVQGGQGLGTGCKPLTTTITLDSSARADTLAKWQRLPASCRTQDRADLQQLNDRWGYFGRPPVPDERVLHYYFNEEPAPGWPKVEVGLEQGGQTRPLSPPVPFYDRSSHTNFLRACNQGVRLRRRRQPRVPPVPD